MPHSNAKGGSGRNPPAPRNSQSKPEVKLLQSINNRISQIESNIKRHGGSNPQPKKKRQPKRLQRQARHPTTTPKSHVTISTGNAARVGGGAGPDGDKQPYVLKHPHPASSLAYLHRLLAPDKYLLKRAPISPTRTPTGLAATSVGYIKSTFEIIVPVNEARMFIAYPAGPYISKTSGTPGEYFIAQQNVIGLSSKADTTSSVHGLSPEDWNAVPVEDGALLWNAVQGTWALSGAQPDVIVTQSTRGRDYRLTSGVLRVTYPVNAFQSVIFESFVTQTGANSGFPDIPETKLIPDLRRDSLAKKIEMGAEDEPGCCVRWLGPSDLQSFRSPVPANNIFSGASDVVTLLREMWSRRFDATAKIKADPTNLAQFNTSADHFDYVPCLNISVSANNNSDPVKFIAEIAYSYEFTPEQGDGMVTEPSVEDANAGELLRASMDGPFMSGPNSFFDTLFSTAGSTVGGMLDSTIGKLF